MIRVVAEVARNYAVLRGLQLRVALLKENIARAEDNVKLTLSRFKQGLAAEGDNLLAQRELEALNAAVPPLNSAIFDAVSRIGLLLGTYSGDVTVELKKPGALPHTPERVRTGQPIELLRRRRTFGRLSAACQCERSDWGGSCRFVSAREHNDGCGSVQGGREIPGRILPLMVLSGQSARARTGRCWTSANWTPRSSKPNTGPARFWPTTEKP